MCGVYQRIFEVQKSYFARNSVPSWPVKLKEGRAFLRRLIDLTHGVRLSHHLIKLNGKAKEDLNVWLSFLSTFNG
jgi:hypothetical protein